MTVFSSFFFLFFLSNFLFCPFFLPLFVEVSIFTLCFIHFLFFFRFSQPRSHDLDVSVLDSCTATWCLVSVSSFVINLSLLIQFPVILLIRQLPRLTILF